MNYRTEQKRFERRREKMRAMAEAGIAFADIARKMKVSRQRVHQILARYNGGIDRTQEDKRK